MTMVEERPTDDLKVRSNPKVESMLTGLGRRVEELKNTDEWMAMLRVQAKFHKYSASNMLLIFVQNEHATRVAGYRKWQELGRQVKKGEKGLRIFAPMTKKNDEGKSEIFGFKVVSVFDISQTEGDELPIVEWPEAETCPDGLWDQLRDRGEALGLQILIADAGKGPPGARGWFDSSTHQIFIRPATEAGMCATLLHELGHAFDPQLAEDGNRARRELVAESVSYILGVQLGISLDAEVEHYLAHWGGDVDHLLNVMDRVRSAVNKFHDID